ncbi:MAG: AAA family ATPase [Deltaproteobacteria bacterium]|nr:AAA family ATPase [Deltaproteobacteria bacterium]
MKLERLAVEGFGALPPGLELNFAPGCNLVLAPNETGKTTLTRLILGLLYGFGRANGAGHPAVPWGAAPDALTGGALAYRLDGGQGFVVRRHLAGRGEQLSLTDETGLALDPAGPEPGVRHLGWGRGVFRTVACLGLDDLTRAVSGEGGRELRETRYSLRGYFFAEAATRGEVRNPVEVLAAWERERTSLYSPDRRSGREDQAIVEALAQAGGELAQARQAEAAARTAGEERARATREVTQARRRRDQAQEETARWRALARRAELLAQAGALAAQGLAPPELENQAGELARQAAEGATRAATAREAARAVLSAAGLPEQREEARARVARLEGLAGRLTVWCGRQEAWQAGRRELAGRAMALEEEWGLAVPALAALAPELPYQLSALAQEERDAIRRRAALAARLSAWPPPPRRGAGAFVTAAWAFLAGGASLWWARQGGPWPRWLPADAIPPAWVSGLGLFLGLGLLGLGAAAAAWAWGARGRELAWQEGQANLARRVTRAEEDLARLAGARAARTGELGLRVAAAEPASLATALAAARELARRQEELAAEKAALAREREAWDPDLIRLAGREPDLGAARGAAVRARVESNAAALAEADRQEALATAEETRGAAAQTGLSALLAGHGLADLAALSQARERASRAAALGAAADEAVVGWGELTPAEEELTPEAAAQAEAAARERLAQAEEAVAAGAGRLGALDEKLAVAATAEPAAQAAARLADVEEARRALARRHDTLLLAEALLTRAMDQFRLAAQPRLFARAAAHLARASGGAYAWLGTDMFQADQRREPGLQVRPGPGGAERPAGALSRGAREQAYLSLRLALAEEMTAGHESLPLILDDPLVNFDDRRLAETLALLAAAADAGRQVLLLTCHGEQATVWERLTRVRRLEIKPPPDAAGS